MMPKRVQMPDSSIVEFPDTMDDNAIGAVLAKNYKPPQQQSLAPQQPSGGPSRLAPIFPPGQKFSMSTMLENLRPYVSAGAGALGTAAAAPTIPATGPVGPAVGGMAAYTAVDQMMKRASGKDEPNLFGGKGLVGSFEDAATNEIGGKVLGGLFKGSKALFQEFNHPGAVVSKNMLDLGSTFSQYYQSIFGKRATISKWLEDVLASSVKAKSMEESSTKGFALAGGKGYDPNAAASSVQASVQSSALQMKAESNRLGNQAVAHAEANPATIQVPSGVPGLGLPLTISGPIHTSTALDEAHNYLNEQAKNIVPGSMMSQQQTTLGKVARDIIDMTEVKDPKTGKVLYTNPISFRDAWNLKQIADEFSAPPRMASSNAAEITPPSSTRKFYKGLSAALNDDIDSSIPQWQQNAPQAFQAWKQAKEVVGQRLSLLDNPGDSISGILKAAADRRTNLPDIDRVIADPQQLQRALTAGEVKFPSGNRVVSTTRQDFGAYTWQKMLNDNVKPDAVNPGKFVFNAQKAYSDFMDPAFAQSKKLLYSAQTSDNYENLLKSIATTQEKQTSFGSYTKLWIARAGVTLAPALALGYVSGIEHAAPIVGVGLSAAVMARAMTQPTLARAMAAAASGQPLNISQDAFARMLSKAMVGGTVSLVGSDGKSTQGTIGKDGKFVPE